MLTRQHSRARIGSRGGATDHPSRALLESKTPAERLTLLLKNDITLGFLKVGNGVDRSVDRSETVQIVCGFMDMIGCARFGIYSFLSSSLTLLFPPHSSSPSSHTHHTHVPRLLFIKGVSGRFRRRLSGPRGEGRVALPRGHHTFTKRRDSSVDRRGRVQGTFRRGHQYHRRHWWWWWWWWWWKHDFTGSVWWWGGSGS